MFIPLTDKTYYARMIKPRNIGKKNRLNKYGSKEFKIIYLGGVKVGHGKPKKDLSK